MPSEAMAPAGMHIHHTNLLPAGMVLTTTSIVLIFLFHCSQSAAATRTPEYASSAQPTQFQLAMMQTLHAVREGKAPDPALRRTDGSPGTLLDALLPEPRRAEAVSETRRQLAASWRFLGARIPFLSGPTLAALNASFFRHTSVYPQPAVDWRNTIYVTPIQAQYDCASCWAMAAADTVAMATAIATGTPAVPAGVQQICDCSGMTCCQGGWPEDAFSWLVTQGSVTTAAEYNYWAMDGRNCTVASNHSTAGMITGWERVPSYSQLALMKAVNMQPVLIYISASSRDFQHYTSTAPGTPGFNVYDGNCSREVNHAMVVIGYDSDTGYWILKNTWPAFGWGHNGYMYLAMYDGPGKCGMLTVNPIYPIYFPNAPQQVTVQAGSTFPILAFNSFWWQWWTAVSNPCIGIINPCGSGTCYVQDGLPRCMCMYPYVEIVGVPTSKCVDPSPCTNSLINPCGAGSCMDVGDGSYICGCPSGYATGTRVNGAPTCVPVSSTFTYVAQYGDTCERIQALYNVSLDGFQELNPYAVCSGYLAPGVVVTLPHAVACTQQYAVRPGDTCGSISYALSQLAGQLSNLLQPSTYAPDPTPSLLYSVPPINAPAWYSLAPLLALNPSVNCSRLYQYQQLCVQGSSSAYAAAGTSAVCGVTYTTAAKDSCSLVQRMYSLNETYFKALNPGINCQYNGGYFNPGVQLCVGPAADNALEDVNCTEWYTVQQGDSCPQIWNAANLSQFQLLYINPGLQCQAPYLYIGQQICINSPLLANIPDPSYLVYAIQPNDTLSAVQAQFTSKCKLSSITLDRIAVANNVPDWTTFPMPANGTLIIPCVPSVGASCGCAPSLTVCGATGTNYPSYCDARCNFDTPLLQTDSACTACQSACQGRYGMPPDPASACTSGYICPYPTWPPPLTDAAAEFTTSPLCSYRTQTCNRACSLSSAETGIDTSICYSACMACDRVPCSGPPETVTNGSATCPSCSSAGCTTYGRSTTTCLTVCSYWNTFWSPLNP